MWIECGVNVLTEADSERLEELFGTAKIEEIKGFLQFLREAAAHEKHYRGKYMAAKNYYQLNYEGKYPIRYCGYQRCSRAIDIPLYRHGYRFQSDAEYDRAMTYAFAFDSQIDTDSGCGGLI